MRSTSGHLGGGLGPALLAALAAALLVPGRAGAEGARPASAEDAVKARMAAFAEGLPGRAGVVVGLLRDGEASFLALGPADGPAPYDERTVFEVGSVTKVFTAVLLQQAVEAKRMRLDAPAARYLPEGVTLPGPVTLEHLATHRSGLPRVPADLFGDNIVTFFGRLSDPYAKYGEKELYAWLGEAKLRAAPGAAFYYSNAAYGLLGHLVARRAGLAYEALLRRDVLEPLGMVDTAVEPDAALRARLAPGHGAFGQQKAPWSFEVMAPAGALKSTAADLMRFLRAATGDGPPALVATLRATQKKRASRGKPGADVALGWMRGPEAGGRAVVWHNGGTGGSRSFVGFVEGTRTGVVVLTNASAGPDDLAFDLLERLAKSP